MSQTGAPPSATPRGHPADAAAPRGHPAGPRQVPRGGPERLAERVRAALDNPVLVKEFRTRMRGTRAYWLLLIYTLLLAAIVGLMYFGYETAASQDPGVDANTRAARDLGRNIYYFVFIAQAIMVALITPAITAGTVTIEREQRSYELLATTPLRPVDLIRGKLVAAVLFVLLLLTASLPLVSLSFLVGGVSPAEIFFSYLLVALSALLYGAVGIFWSAALKTTAAATVVTYLSVLSLFVVTLIPGVSAAVGAGVRTAVMAEIPFQSLNPVSATLRAVQPEHFFALQWPSWVGGTVLNLLAGLLVAVTAMGRLEHFPPPNPAWGRGLATALWCALALFGFGPLFGGMARGTPTADSVREATGWMLAVMLVLVALVTPLMTTGDLVIRRGESAVGRYLRAIVRPLAAELSSGVPLILAWAVFLFALVPVGFAAIGKAALFRPEAAYLPGLLLCVAVIAALAALGQLLSVTLPSRWAACVLTYLAAVVVMLLPYFTLFPWYQASSRPAVPQLLWQTLYLVPFEGLRELGDPKSFWNDHPALWLGRVVPVWVVTAAAYALAAAGCWVAALACVAREGRRLKTRWEQSRE